MKIKKLYLILIIALCTLLIAVGGAFTYAWLSPYGRVVTEDGGTEYARLGMKLDLLFDMINSDTSLDTVSNGTSLGIVSTDYDLTGYSSETSGDLTKYYYTDTNSRKRYVYGTTGSGDSLVCYYLFDSYADWGTANNPYIISAVRHIQNLSILQEIGYFHELYVKQYEDAEGSYTYNGEDCMPYFLICKSNGEPVTIEGENIQFSPIGTDEYPFIGYVGGAFTDGTTTVEGTSFTCDQSIIKDINIQTTEDILDVGFFGTIGYLKNKSITASDEEPFEGYISTVRDFLLYDVTITVNKTTILDIVEKCAAHPHLFSFSSVGDDITTRPYSVPHENHHFGILAGHVEYSTVKYISIYYSDNSTPAIDISHLVADSSSMAANYYSVCGIIGFIHLMNSSAGDGNINADGITNDDVSVSSGGAGTGGGTLSGTGRGYVTAASICKNYYTSFDSSASPVTGSKANVMVNSKKGQVVWKYLREGESSLNYGIMLDYDGINYTLHEDSSVTANVSSVGAQVPNGNDTNTWTNYIVCTITSDGTTETCAYTDESGNSLSYFKAMDLRIYDGQNLDTDAKLCTEYIRNRILWGTDPTGMYYFYDGVFTFALSDDDDVIEDTWNNDTPDTITVGENDATKWTTDSSGQSNSVVAFASPITSQAQLGAQRKLFITYKDSEGKYHLVTLAGNSSYESGKGDDACTTPATTLSLVTTEKKSELKNLLDLGALTLDTADPESGAVITEDKLKEQWDSISVFDVGSKTSSVTLADLKNLYPVAYEWHDTEADTKIYEDDNSTLATDTLKNNALTAKNTYYQINSTIDTDVNVLDPDNPGTPLYTYFKLGTNPVAVSKTDLETAVSTQNSTYYEEDWTTKTSDSTSPLNGRISANNQITQQEWHIYSDGYFYFKTSSRSALTWYLNYYYVDGNGTEYSLGESDWVYRYTWENTLLSFFEKSSNTDAYGTYLYTHNYNGSKTLPLLYYENNTYYQGWTRNLGDWNYLKGSDSIDLTFAGGLYYKTYTAYYNFILATLTGNGIQYSWLGSTTACTDVAKTTGRVASASNLNRGIYLKSGDTVLSANYYYYSCKVNGVDKTGILVTKYGLDGYSLKSLKATGIRYLLNGTTTLSGAGTLTSQNPPSRPTGMSSPQYTLTLGEKNYDLYTVDSKLVVRVANYDIDGYILATVNDTEASYALYSSGQPVAQTGVTTFKDTIGNALTLSLSNGTRSRDYALYTSTQGAMAILLMTSGQSGGYYEFYHKNSADADDPFVLRLLKRNYYFNTNYSVMVGTNAHATDASQYQYGIITPTVSNTAEAKLTFNSDGSVYVSYTLDGQLRFLHYDETNNHFDTSSSTSTSGTKLYLFMVEGYHDTTTSNKIVPVVGTSQGTYAADQYVLYPQSTLTSSAGTASATTSADPIYKLVSLDELYNQDSGWKNGEGNRLSKTDLYKRFSLTEEIEWGVTLNAFNGSWNFGTGGINSSTVVAPIGTNGEEANIPKGCVAFKINDSSQTSYGVRVIVSIPVSEYTTSQSGYDLDTDEDYYFGIWHTEEAGESTIQSFQKTNAQEKFELPRSHPYETGADPATSDYINVTLGDDTNTYRAYLHGDQILVAYKFTVTDPGVYVIGATNGPMQIVYFSADSAASSGRDGTSSYKLGTIDFVYDYNNKIVTVKDAATSGSGTEDYQYYYPTLCLLGTNNGADPDDRDTDIDSYTGKTSGTSFDYPNINDFKIYVKRMINSSTDAEIQYRVTTTTYDKGYISFVRYALNSDVLTATDAN